MLVVHFMLVVHWILALALALALTLFPESGDFILSCRHLTHVLFGRLTLLLSLHLPT